MESSISVCDGHGSVAFYFCIPKYYRELGCEMAEPVGTNYEAACGEDGQGGRAATLNALFEEWNEGHKADRSNRQRLCVAAPSIGCFDDTRGEGRQKSTGCRSCSRSTPAGCEEWLGREGSNLRMAESKSAALPLGYAPTGSSGSGRTLAPRESRPAPRVYRGRSTISTADAAQFSIEDG
jgi:hypothetical protein